MTCVELDNHQALKSFGLPLDFKWLCQNVIHLAKVGRANLLPGSISVVEDLYEMSLMTCVELGNHSAKKSEQVHLFLASLGRPL